MGKHIWISFVGDIILIANIFLFLRGSAKRGRAFKFFLYYLIAIGLVQIASKIIGKLFHLPNLYLSHFYFLSQFILLSLFYSELLKSRWIRFGIALVLLFVGYQFVTDPGLFFRYNTLGMAITNAILVVYAIVYLYRSLSASNGFITVTVGVFLYLLSSALIFASGNLVLNLELSEEMNFYLINVNRVLYVVFQILIFVEWFRNYRRKKA